MNKDYDKLFDLFSPVSARQWKQKIQADLKGADYATLITKTPEGIDIRPFYHPDEFRAADHQLPETRFIAATSFDRVPGPEQVENRLKHLAGRIHIRTALPLQAGALSEFKEHIVWHQDAREWEPVTALAAGGFEVQTGPLDHLTRYGRWMTNENRDLQNLKQLTENHENFFVQIDAAHLADAGAHLVQQAAYALTQAAWYAGKGIDPARLRPCLAVGTRYLSEIAKLRSFSHLWQSLFGQKAFVCVRPTLRNKTLRDPYMNMLRTGMEMMAAVLGGADEIINLPYDYLHARNEDSERLALNQLLLLKYESPFANDATVYRGAYFSEEMIDRLSRKTADLFEQIQAGGGYVQQLFNGNIQRKIQQAAAKEQAAYNEGRIVLTGSNKYLIDAEEIPRPLPRAFTPKRREKTLIPVVVAHRLAEADERAIIQNLRP